MFRHVQLDEVDHLAGKAPAQVADHLVGDPDRHQTQGYRTESQSLAAAGDGDVGDFARERRIAGILGVHERDSVLEIQRIDDVALALVQVHRPRMDGGRGLTRPGTAQQPPGVGLHDDDLAAGRAPDVHRGMWF